MSDAPSGKRSLAAYRPWFYAAAVYNAVWGTATILFPHAYFELIGMDRLDHPALWRGVGMLLLIYAPAFWWVARNPWRHPHLVLIATAGKVLGPIGFLAAYLAGELPARFGLLMITNDLIWLPAFFLYLRAVAGTGGLGALLMGGGSSCYGITHMGKTDKESE